MVPLLSPLSAIMQQKIFHRLMSKVNYCILWLNFLSYCEYRAASIKDIVVNLHILRWYLIVFPSYIQACKSSLDLYLCQWNPGGDHTMQDKPSSIPTFGRN